jgi:hypothetical protein
VLVLLLLLLVLVPTEADVKEDVKVEAAACRRELGTGNGG